MLQHADIQLIQAYKRDHEPCFARGVAAITKSLAILEEARKQAHLDFADRPKTEEHPAVLNGTWPTYQSFLSSAFWKTLRARALAVAENRCQACNREGHLNVHHRRYQGKWGQETLSDVIVLCSSCHMKIHDIKWEKADDL